MMKTLLKNIKNNEKDEPRIKVVLASRSPRRQELLKNIGVNFDVLVSNFDEKSLSFENMTPHEYASTLALKKADAVCGALKTEPDVQYFIIGADTIVILNGKILGQPADAKDAERMLKMLSGCANQVITGLAVICLKDGVKTLYSGSESTLVYFKQLDEREISNYIATGEPLRDWLRFSSKRLKDVILM